jgi:hypothetical protein
VKHYTTEGFRRRYAALSPSVRARADRSFDRLRQSPDHPALRLKKVGDFWSARVSRSYRALAIEDDGDLIWFWIGNHDEYDRLIG